MSTADYFPLPISLEDLTPRWLTAALRQREPQAEVLACYAAAIWESSELEPGSKWGAMVDHDTHGLLQRITVP